MGSYAVIDAGKVINVVEADTSIANENGFVAITTDVGIGWDYVNGQFVDNRPKPEAPSAPPAPTKEQLLAQLQTLQAQIQALE